MDSTDDVAAMFGSLSDGKAEAEMSKAIVLEEVLVAYLEEQAKTRKLKLASMKTALAKMLMQNAKRSCPVPGGLKPTVRIDKTYYQASGAPESEVHKWLLLNNLDSIIKPYIHNSDLKEALEKFEADGNVLPNDLFGCISTPTVVMYGRAKYLTALGMAALDLATLGLAELEEPK